jgi:hypothetical protein
LDVIPEHLRTMLRDDQFVTSNGSAGLRIEMDLRFAELRSMLELSLRNGGAQGGGTTTGGGGARTPHEEPSRFSWGSRLHPVPEGFRFPKCDVLKMWELWFFGNPAHRIAPYKTFKTYDLLKADHTLLSKAALVMTFLQSLCDDNLLPRDYNSCMIQSRQIFGTAFLGLLSLAFPDDTELEQDRRRPGSLSYVTFYDIVLKIRRQRARNHDDDANN